MDKNQSIIGLIIVVLVVVCIFVYFVFRPQAQNEETPDNTEDGVMYEFDVDVNEDTATTNEDVIAEIAHIAEDDVVTEDVRDEAPAVAMHNEKEEKVVAPAQTAPKTGPGAYAFVVAMIVALGSSIFVMRHDIV